LSLGWGAQGTEETKGTLGARLPRRGIDGKRPATANHGGRLGPQGAAVLRR
jgi:hypothetical protein